MGGELQAGILRCAACCPPAGLPSGSMGPSCCCLRGVGAARGAQCQGVGLGAAGGCSNAGAAVSSVNMRACKRCAQKHRDVCGVCTTLCMLMHTSMCVHGAMLHENVCLPAALPLAHGWQRTGVQVHACTCINCAVRAWTHLECTSVHPAVLRAGTCAVCVHVHLAVLCMHSVPALQVLPRW